MKTYSIIVRSIFTGTIRTLTTKAWSPTAAMTKVLKEHPGFVGVGFA